MCGGCKVALTQELQGSEPGEGGFIADWIGMLDEVRKPIAKELGVESREAELAMEMAAVRVSLDNLTTFPCIRRKTRDGELRLHGAFFAISDGVLHFMDEKNGAFLPAE
jgi:carbonic anhydrase